MEDRLLLSMLAPDVEEPGGEGIGGELQLVGYWDGHDHTYSDVWGEGDYAYLGHVGAGDGVDVIDISDPANPTLVATFVGSAGGRFWDIQVRGGIGFFAADSGEGVYVVDLSDPANPVELARITSAAGGHDRVHNVFIDGDYLYEADSRTSSVKVFNVSNPAAPVFVRSITSPTGSAVHDITVVNGTLFTSVIGGEGGTDVFDVSNVEVAAPLLGTFASGRYTHSNWPTTDGNHLVIARENVGGTGGADVAIWDIRDPANTTRVAVLDPGVAAFSPHNPLVDGNLLYVSWYDAGLRVFDISDPTNPVPVAFYDTYPGTAASYAGNWGVYPFLGPDRVLASDMQTGLYIVSTAAPLALDDNAVTDEDTAVTIAVLANDTDLDGDALSVSAATDPPGGSVTINADGTITYVPDLNFNGTDTFTYEVCDPSPACNTATATITVNPVPDELVVTSLTPTTSGFVAQFNRTLDASVLNLYDVQAGTLGAADATLVGASVGPVKGSLVIDLSLMKITFVATGGLFTSIAGDGVLPADTYTVTMRSAADGFKDTSGNLLDGNGDDVAGDDYVNSFTVGSSTAVQVGVPDLARGPGQPVDVPATAANGIPIRLSDGNGVDTIDLTLTYDPALLNISAVALGSAMPSGSTLTSDLTTPGTVVISVSIPGGLGAGAIDVVTMTADVPCSAAYASAQVLDLTAVSLNGGAIAAADDDGVHAVAYFGDATGNGGYSGLDSQRVQRVVVDLDSGFLAYPLVDPVVIADITGNGSLSGLDGTRIQQEVVGLDRLEIPAIPVCSSPSAAVASAPRPSSGTASIAVATDGGAGMPNSAAVADSSAPPLSSPSTIDTFLKSGAPAMATRPPALQDLVVGNATAPRRPVAAQTAGGAASESGQRQSSAEWQNLPQLQTSPGAPTALALPHRARSRPPNPAPPSIPAPVPRTAWHEDLEDLIALLASDQSR